MAHISAHLAQADHNREVSRHLLEPPRHDWAITAAFYAAIHYFEAWLYDQPEEHSETSIPTGVDGKLRMTVHAWRARLIQQRLSREGFKGYRKLHEGSETARYLSLFKVGSSSPQNWISAPAPDHFPPEAARVLVEVDLEKLRAELGAEWRSFLEGLGLSNRDPIAGRLARGKLLARLKSREELLRQSEQSLRSFLGPSELTLLREALAEKGMTLGQGAEKS